MNANFDLKIPLSFLSPSFPCSLLSLGVPSGHAPLMCQGTWQRQFSVYLTAFSIFNYVARARAHDTQISGIQILQMKLSTLASNCLLTTAGSLTISSALARIGSIKDKGWIVGMIYLFCKAWCLSKTYTHRHTHTADMTSCCLDWCVRLFILSDMCVCCACVGVRGSKWKRDGDLLMPAGK